MKKNADMVIRRGRQFVPKYASKVGTFQDYLGARLLARRTVTKNYEATATYMQLAYSAI